MRVIKKSRGLLGHLGMKKQFEGIKPSAKTSSNSTANKSDTMTEATKSLPAYSIVLLGNYEPGGGILKESLSSYLGVTPSNQWQSSPGFCQIQREGINIQIWDIGIPNRYSNFIFSKTNLILIVPNSAKDLDTYKLVLGNVALSKNASIYYLNLADKDSVLYKEIGEKARELKLTVASEGLGVSPTLAGAKLYEQLTNKIVDFCLQKEVNKNKEALKIPTTQSSISFLSHKKSTQSTGNKTRDSNKLTLATD